MRRRVVLEDDEETGRLGVVDGPYGTLADVEHATVGRSTGTTTAGCTPAS